MAFVCLGVCAGHGATWYAAAGGSSTNGTPALPWSVPYAASNTNPHLQPGDTVLFKAGVFNCNQTNSTTFGYNHLLAFEKGGLPNAKITYRSEKIWGFRFNGGLIIPYSASNIIVRDFVISFTGMTNRNVTNYSGSSLGINAFAVGSEIMHNVIENTGHPGIGSWSGTSGKYIAGNIIRFIGFNDYSPAASGLGTPAGSAMYLQHSAFSPEALIQGNITYYNYTTGMKAYGNDNINGFNFTHNITANNGAAGIYYHQDKADSQGVNILTNFLWQNSIGLGYQLGNANPSNAVIVGNYSSSDNPNGNFAIEDGWAHCIITNNTFVNPVYQGLIQMESSGQTNHVGAHIWDYNRYYAGASHAYGYWSFMIGGSVFPWIDWTNRINGDTHSSFVSSSPPPTVIFAFRPSTDTNFVHVAVYNWETNATATVNLSAYFPVGAQLSIYDAQNIPNAYTNVTFGGSTVTLDLTRTNRATMLGTFSHRSDSWTGFDSRFRAFVVYRYGDRLSPPSNLQVGQ